MKGPRAKNRDGNTPPNEVKKADGQKSPVTPKEAVQETFALPPSPPQWNEETGTGLKVEGVPSCLG